MDVKQPDQPKTKNIDDQRLDRAKLEVLLQRAIQQKQWGMVVYYKAIVRSRVTGA